MAVWHLAFIATSLRAIYKCEDQPWLSWKHTASYAHTPSISRTATSWENPVRSPGEWWDWTGLYQIQTEEKKKGIWCTRLEKKKKKKPKHLQEITCLILNTNFNLYRLLTTNVIVGPNVWFGGFSIRTRLKLLSNACKLNFGEVTTAASKMSCSFTATAVDTTPNNHPLLWQ